MNSRLTFWFRVRSAIPMLPLVSLSSLTKEISTPRTRSPERRRSRTSLRTTLFSPKLYPCWNSPHPSYRPPPRLRRIIGPHRAVRYSSFSPLSELARCAGGGRMFSDQHPLAVGQTHGSQRTNVHEGLRNFNDNPLGCPVHGRLTVTTWFTRRPCMHSLACRPSAPRIAPRTPEVGDISVFFVVVCGSGKYYSTSRIQRRTPILTVSAAVGQDGSAYGAQLRRAKRLAGSSPRRRILSSSPACILDKLRVESAAVPVGNSTQTKIIKAFRNSCAAGKEPPPRGYGGWEGGHRPRRGQCNELDGITHYQCCMPPQSSDNADVSRAQHPA